MTAIEDIPQKEELISFPEKMILNIDKILDLINSPELKTQYENFKKLEMESRNDAAGGDYTVHSQQAHDAVRVLGAQEHALRDLARHLAGSEVGHHDHGLAHHILGGVVFGDAAAHGAGLAAAHVQGLL